MIDKKIVVSCENCRYWGERKSFSDGAWGVCTVTDESSEFHFTGVKIVGDEKLATRSEFYCKGFTLATRFINATIEFHNA